MNKKKLPPVSVRMSAEEKKIVEELGAKTGAKKTAMVRWLMCMALEEIGLSSRHRVPLWTKNKINELTVADVAEILENAGISEIDMQNYRIRGCSLLDLRKAGQSGLTIGQVAGLAELSNSLDTAIEGRQNAQDDALDVRERK